MRGWLPLALGLLGTVTGAVWTLQGLGRLDGSVMTGQRLWAVVGPMVAASLLGSSPFGFGVNPYGGWFW